MTSTFVNDLRLNEQATGDNSGSWGTVTNTNLELIAEAFSFGTEAITTNADTHTTTIADGATDPGRSMFLKYTGTLDSACTITIGPNTVSKLWFIENGTSGSQNIIIKQGSGATITIPPGDTKAIYSDGAGSSGAMVDAFASLSVVDLKVQDDLTVTDDMTVGGVSSFADGSTSAPSITNTGDLDTGISFPAANSIAFSTAGTQRTLINADGFYDYAGAANDVARFSGPNSGSITIRNDTANQLILHTGTSDALVLGTGGNNDRLTIDAAGAATFSSTLGVTGAATFSSTIAATSADLRNNSGGAETTALSLRNFVTSANTATALNFFPTQSTTRFASIVAENVDGNNNIALSFLTSAGDTPSAALTLNQDRTATFSADVTVGGTTPTLTIGDAGAEDAKIVFDGNAVNFHIGNDDSADTLKIGTGTALGTTPRLSISTNNVIVNELGVDVDTIIRSNGNDNMLIVDGGADRVCIGTNNSGLNLANALGTSRLTVADGILFGTSSNTTSYIGTGDTTGDVAIVANATPGNLGSTRTVRIKGGTSGGGGPTEMATFDATSGSIFNPARTGVVDFRIASGAQNHMFFIDSGADCINIGHATNTVGDSSGTLMVNFAGNVANGIKIRDSRGESGTNNAMIFIRGDDFAGAITTTSAPATQYTTASDERLKENIANADDASSKIDAIKVRKFDWKGNGSHQDFGLIAQELQPIAPDAVVGDPESEKMMSIDPAKLVPMMLKEIQSLRVRITALES